MVIILLPEIGQKMKVSEKSILYQYKGEDALVCLFKGLSYRDGEGKL